MGGVVKNNAQKSNSNPLRSQLLHHSPVSAWFWNLLLLHGQRYGLLHPRRQSVPVPLHHLLSTMLIDEATEKSSVLIEGLLGNLSS